MVNEKLLSLVGLPLVSINHSLGTAVREERPRVKIFFATNDHTHTRTHHNNTDASSSDAVVTQPLQLLILCHKPTNHVVATHWSTAHVMIWTQLPLLFSCGMPMRLISMWSGTQVRSVMAARCENSMALTPQ